MSCSLPSATSSARERELFRYIFDNLTLMSANDEMIGIINLSMRLSPYRTETIQLQRPLPIHV